MRIGGFQRLTLVDYPGRVAATVFTQGCNFRCGFCHNPHLVLPERFMTSIPTREVLSYCASRRGKIEGVVISGGEPTMQAGLAEFMSILKGMGFLIKLDTNGSNPKTIKSLIDQGLVDFIAMDIKTSWQKYHTVIGVPYDLNKLRQSVGIIIESGIAHQFRTTDIGSLCSMKDKEMIKNVIIGCDQHVYQDFIPTLNMLNPNFLSAEIKRTS